LYHTESPFRKSHKDLDVVFNFNFLVEIVIFFVHVFFTFVIKEKSFDLYWNKPNIL